MGTGASIPTSVDAALKVFTVSQIYLSDAISGRDKALMDLRNQINELSKRRFSDTHDW